MKLAGMTILRLVEFLIAKKDSAGDDAGAILKKHERPRLGAQPAARIPISALPEGQFTPEDPRLHLLDAPATVALGLVAHRKDSGCGD